MPDTPPLDQHHMIRVFSFAHGPVEQEDPAGEFFVNRYHEHADGAREVAAWKNRVYEAGWIPKIHSERTSDALFVIGIAFPPNPALEEKVGAIAARLLELEGAVASLAGNMESMVGAVNRLMGTGIIRPT